MPHHHEFSLDATTATIGTIDEKMSLFHKDVNYEVPIYQRPYSWGEKEIMRLLNDLWNCYTGNAGGETNEAMFIGTIQRSPLLNASTYELIDGQQRLTTLLLLLHDLQPSVQHSELSAQIPTIERLQTRVLSGRQQELLKQALTSDALATDSVNNPYIEARRLISKFLQGAGKESQHDDDISGSAPSDEDILKDFVRYLLHRVYFVVITTQATLSKTIQIFDSINTSGMELSGTDAFKIRYFEYLRYFDPSTPDSIFEDISQLYSEAEEAGVSFREVLEAAQHWMIVYYGMNRSLHSQGAETFFQRYFDTVLHTNKWETFSHDQCHRARLEMQHLKRWTDATVTWHKAQETLPPLARSLHPFFWCVGYGKFSILRILFWETSGRHLDQTSDFVIQIAKILVSYRILKWRTCNEAWSLLHQLRQMLCSHEPSDCSQILEDLKAHRSGEHWRDRIIYNLNHDQITGNAYCKNSVCRCLALIYEEASNPEEDHSKLLFETWIDIEHIQSYNDHDLENREIISKEWGEEMNRLGNLIILEGSINRSISNSAYQEKLRRYPDSSFNIVKDHALQFPASWTKKMAEQRREHNTDLLIRFLCQDEIPVPHHILTNHSI